MRVNLERQIWSDPKVLHLASILRMDHRAVIGHLAAVWFACFEQQTDVLMHVHVDLAAGINGFAAAMISSGLASEFAESYPQTRVHIHGVADRIAWYMEQRSRGRSGASKRWANHAKRNAGANSSDSQRYSNPMANANADAIANANADAMPNAMPNAMVSLWRPYSLRSGSGSGSRSGSGSGSASSSFALEAGEREKTKSKAIALPKSSPSGSEGIQGELPTSTQTPAKRERTAQRLRRGKYALPSDWQPTEAHAALADELRLNLRAEADRFRDHFAANGKPLADWHAAFRNWLRRSRDFQPTRQNAKQSSHLGSNSAVLVSTRPEHRPLPPPPPPLLPSEAPILRSDGTIIFDPVELAKALAERATSDSTHSVSRDDLNQIHGGAGDGED